MKKHKKSIVIFIIITSLIGGIFWYYHPTYYKYNDRFIVGSFVDQIIDKYGDFDKVFYADTENKTIAAGGYLVGPKRIGYLGTSWEKYYLIVFDASGKAMRVSIVDGG